MSIDVLQEKIRKTKNPSVILFEANPEWLPPHLREGDISANLERFCRELLDGLKGLVPAVRFGFGSFALLGEGGVKVLSQMMAYARERGFYVLMDLPELLTPTAARNAAEAARRFSCDGVVVGCYLGSDVLSPLRSLCETGKTVFAVCRTANKSAVELQDLLTGGRLVHTAAADVIARHAEPAMAKCGYSQMGAVAAASSAQSVRTLRNKFPKLFLLLDGYDYPSSNAKNCAGAFDRFGHGAAACASEAVLAAWREENAEDVDFVQQAKQAADRMKKNLTRYITIL